MFTRNRVHTHESGTKERNNLPGPQRPRCAACRPHGPAGLFQRNLDHPKMDGVSTYLALIFGTLLSSQGTDASFVLTLSGFPPGASLRCFRLYQIFPIRFPRCLPGSRSRVSLSGGLTLSDPFGADSPSAGAAFRTVGPFRRVRL